MRDHVVKILSDPSNYLEKEQLYLDVRRLEGRILTDITVSQLPSINADGLYSREWIWRAKTLERFLKYISVKFSNNSPLQILDLGCGNGWMSNRIAEKANFEVWGVDLNLEELTQGLRLFGRENLHFIYADLLSYPEEREMNDSGTSFNTIRFDLIVLAASIQYFPDIKVLILQLRNRLNKKGEIHILDAPFYENLEEKALAQQRTLAYYTSLGLPQMAQYYHHHILSEVRELGGENLNDNLKIKFLQKMRWLAPFPWLRFKTPK